MNLWWKLFLSGLAIGLVIGWWLASSESFGQDRNHILIECRPGARCIPVGVRLPKIACQMDLVSRAPVVPSGTRLSCEPVSPHWRRPEVEP